MAISSDLTFFRNLVGETSLVTVPHCDGLRLVPALVGLQSWGLGRSNAVTPRQVD